MNKEQLIMRGLPKWPQMKVTGKNVSREQALDILARTDSFFEGNDGNDHAFNERLRKLLGMPAQPGYGPDVTPDIVTKYCHDLEYWRKTWQYVETEYVRNSWISSAFIFGPYGWCRPTGIISFEDNIGKWPSIESVLNDWTILAQAFPYLDIGVTLMSGEECEEEIEPVVSLAVKDGQVELLDPRENFVHKDHVWHRRSGGFEEQVQERLFGNFLRNEHGIGRAEILFLWERAIRLGLASDEGACSEKLL